MEIEAALLKWREATRFRDEIREIGRQSIARFNHVVDLILHGSPIDFVCDTTEALEIIGVKSQGIMVTMEEYHAMIAAMMQEKR